MALVLWKDGIKWYPNEEFRITVHGGKRNVGRPWDGKPMEILMNRSGIWALSLKFMTIVELFAFFIAWEEQKFKILQNCFLCVISLTPFVFSHWTFLRMCLICSLTYGPFLFLLILMVHVSILLLVSNFLVVLCMLTIFLRILFLGMNMWKWWPTSEYRGKQNITPLREDK